MAKKQLTFEKAMEQLEKVVASLESGGLSLEKSLKQFEQGMKLSQYCSEKLDETEKKITLLMESNLGSIDELPYDNSDD